MPNRISFCADILCERGQMRREIVAAALLKLFEKVAGPIRAENFKAIAENCIRRIRTKRLHQLVAHFREMPVDGGPIVMIENETLRANTGAFHLLPSAAGDKEQHLSASGRRGHSDAPVLDICQTLMLGIKGGQQFFAILHWRDCNGLVSLCGRYAFNSQRTRCFIYRGLWTAVRPTAAEGDIHPHAQRLCRRRSEANITEKLVGEISGVVEVLLGIVELKRINGLNLNTPDV